MSSNSSHPNAADLGLLESEKMQGEASKRVRLNLFWRTFSLLGLLLIVSILAWLQTLRVLHLEPRSVHTVQQLSLLVHMSRTALLYADPLARTPLLKRLADKEGLRIQPRLPEDQFVAIEPSAINQLFSQTLARQLGPSTIVAGSVNSERGLWIGFSTGRDAHWMRMDISRLQPDNENTWWLWLIMAGVLSLAGAATIAQLINQPLKRLSDAANKVQEGDFSASHLDEEAVTNEIREVNIGFNRMAEKLAKLEQDRAVMLAGISHDLRTPLARLRLETEMSVFDEVARDHMVADIMQLDATIDKFLDYARPDHVTLKPVNLHAVMASCVYPVQDDPELQITMEVPQDLNVLADEVELARIISNLLENARRYGKTPDSTGVAHVNILAKGNQNWVSIKVRDHGLGVSPEQLPDLIKPFFRGDVARTAAAGAGLGLSIVDKTVRRMGGLFALANSGAGGLTAHVQLQRARDLSDSPNQLQRLHRPQTKPKAAAMP